MGNRRISDDLKDAALRMANKGYATTEILSITQISTSTIYRTQCRKRATGSVAKIQAIGRGRPRAFTQHDIQFVIRLACHNPTLFLDAERTWRNVIAIKGLLVCAKPVDFVTDSSLPGVPRRLLQ
ncbi:hypothetical protein F4604DRAFT_1932895 [Suillus subluteus]|nr:hypothetical protein F4604DRAFT_1932895 [Suillus subluteus]